MACTALTKLLQQHQQIVTYKDLSDSYSSLEIRNQIKKGNLSKITRGIYAGPNTLDDAFYTAELRYKRGIISLSTALYIYRLSDRIPDKIDLTFPRGYKTTLAKKNNIEAHLQIKKLWQLGITNTTTLAGHPIKIYSLERTMAEILRKTNHVDSEIINQAYKQYVQLPNKKISKLLFFARKFKTLNLARTYLEALL